MSTRANIELYDAWGGESDVGRWMHWKKGAVLYHHCDGYPAWMGPELQRKLKEAKKELDKAGFPYWWDSERVGALIVKLSADESEIHNSVPAFQPCCWSSCGNRDRRDRFSRLWLRWFQRQHRRCGGAHRNLNRFYDGRFITLLFSGYVVDTNGELPSTRRMNADRFRHSDLVVRRGNAERNEHDCRVSGVYVKL